MSSNPVDRGKVFDTLREAGYSVEEANLITSDFVDKGSITKDQLDFIVQKREDEFPEFKRIQDLITGRTLDREEAINLFALTKDFNSAWDILEES